MVDDDMPFYGAGIGVRSTGVMRNGSAGGDSTDATKTSDATATETETSTGGNADDCEKPNLQKCDVCLQVCDRLPRTSVT